MHPSFLPRPSGSLYYSSSWAAAELASLKQSSPKTPAVIALLGMAAGDSCGAMPFSYCDYALPGSRMPLRGGRDMQSRSFLNLASNIKMSRILFKSSSTLSPGLKHFTILQLVILE